MTDLRGPAEARLLHAERGIAAMDRDLRELRRQAIALSQGLWAEWGAVSAPGPANTSTSFSGTVDGCNSGISGVTITVTDHATSAVLATVTSGAAGAFSGSVTISGTVSVDFSGGGTGWTTTTTNESMMEGTATTGVAINLTAASGYVCVAPCNNPVPTTLTVTDTAFGGVSFPAYYTGVFSGLATWTTGSPPQTIAFPAGAGCTAVSAVPCTYTLTVGSSFASVLTYISVGVFNACPATSGSGASSPHHLVSSACPPSFSVAFANIASQKVYGNAAAGTYTITWTG